MKHHKLFQTALSVSIQERREQYPEKADEDIIKAPKIIGGRYKTAIWRRRQAEQPAKSKQWWAEFELRQSQPQSPEQRQRDVQRLEAERQAAAQQYAERARLAEEQRKAEYAEREAQCEIARR